MKGKLVFGIPVGSLAVLGFGAIYAEVHDKYSVKVPGGLAFSEFKGYESWRVIGVSHQADQSADARGDGVLAVILANPVMIELSRPFTEQDCPPQGNDAKCGVACHTIAKSRDYVFTEYATR